METDWFGEKTVQVVPKGFIAFDIDIESRYGNAGELLTMLGFAQKAALIGMANLIDSVSCDSKAGLYEVITNDSLFVRGGEGDRALFGLASEFLRHFLWQGEEHIASDEG